MRRRTAAALAAALGMAALLAYASWLWAIDAFRAPGPSTSDMVLIFPKGTGLVAIAERLETSGIVRSRHLFRFGAHVEGAERQLQAGEYRFPAGVSAYQAMMQMREGRRVARRVTVPEGLTVVEVQKLLLATEGLTDEESLPPVEDGALLPETYFYAYGDTAASVQLRMSRAMREALAEAWEKRKPNIAVRTPEEALVLASIIEKETGRADERARVSAVYHNRLRRGMKLQADPTTVYGLTQGKAPLGRELTRADLRAENAFNTYVIDGLPPRPIANPGKAALLAAVRPAETRELFFVADGDGGHHFAETLEEHNRNVAKWRRIQREAKE